MNSENYIIRKATHITPPNSKAVALLATMYNGGCSNGSVLMLELYETSGNISDNDRREVCGSDGDRQNEMPYLRTQFRNTMRRQARRTTII